MMNETGVSRIDVQLASGTSFSKNVQRSELASSNTTVDNSGSSDHGKENNTFTTSDSIPQPSMMFLRDITTSSGIPNLNVSYKILSFANLN